MKLKASSDILDSVTTYFNSGESDWGWVTHCQPILILWGKGGGTGRGGGGGGGGG